jgi:hypothetical protein
MTLLADIQTHNISIADITAFVVALTPILLGIFNLVYLLAVGRTADSTHTMVNSHNDILTAKSEALVGELAAQRGESIAAAKVAATTISALKKDT